MDRVSTDTAAASPAAPAEALVQALYEGILQRPADPAGLEHYAAVVRQTGTPVPAIRALVESDELWRALVARHQVQTDRGRSAAGLGWSRDVEHVCTLFERRLGRVPTGPEMAHLVAGGRAGLSARTRDLLGLRGVPPFRDPAHPRILLFGAFGNGNIGDSHQAVAVCRLLSLAWGVPETSFYATSVLRQMDYPFPADRKLPAEAVQDMALLDGFDVLVIGGGGLLAHPHDPLMDDAWVDRVRVPMVCLAIGASRALVAAHEPLLMRAWSVSGRDQASLAALQSVRPDAFLLRDPILSCGDADVFGPSTAPAQSAGTLWILKFPSGDADERALDEIGRIIATRPGRHVIAAVEPLLDVALERRFGTDITYVTRFDQLCDLCRQATAVVSMRYHGAIAAALAGRPCLSLSQSKIAALHDELGLPGVYVDDPAAILPTWLTLQASSCPPSPIAATLAALRNTFLATVKTSDLSCWMQGQDERS